jgi:hypothetical protein
VVGQLTKGWIRLQEWGNNTCSNLCFSATLAAASSIARSASSSIIRDMALFACCCNTHLLPRFLKVIPVLHDGYYHTCNTELKHKSKMMRLNQKRGFHKFKKIGLNHTYERCLRTEKYRLLLACGFAE